VRSPVATLVAIVAVTGSACSGVSHHAGGSHGSPCPLFAELDRTARAVGKADVSDPGQFQQTLDTATKHYAATARELRKVVPVRLRSDVDRLEAAVEQYRFGDAATARRHLDDYAARTCGKSPLSG
jgi:hypothetical protein